MGNLRELADTYTASNSLWILFQSHFKAPQASISSFVPLPPILTFCPSYTYLHCWPQLSTKTQWAASHIPQSWGHKLQFSPPTVFNPFENGNTGWRSHCIKSICRLNFLQSEAWIRLAFSCCYSAKAAVCLFELMIHWDLTGHDIHKAPDWQWEVHLQATKATNLQSLLS